MLKKFWTPEEIRFLIQAYKEGIREKEIARMMDRTLSSVGKKIDILGLRLLYGRSLRNPTEKKRLQEKTQKKEQRKISPAMEDLQRALPVILSPLERMTKKTHEGIDHNGLNWVTFPDVMQWLESLGTRIHRSPVKNTPYLCEGQYLNEAQVLLFCNRVRLEQNLPIVHVPGITELE